MTSLVWLDGAVVDVDEARISPFDHGMTVGDGVFETLKVVDGRPFALRRHLERLDRSAQGLGLTPVDHEVVAAATAEVISANAITNGRLRITLTGGDGPLGSARGDSGPTLLVAVGGPAPIDHGVDVITVEWTRNERGALVGLKTTSYAENVVALARATAAGAGEAIFANTVGNLCEGTGSNIFVGMGGRLITPPLSTGPLAGITRELVLEATDAVEEDLPFEALAQADEAFLTSSIRDVQGIRAVDGVALPHCPGPLTLAAATSFAELMAANLDP